MEKQRIFVVLSSYGFLNRRVYCRFFDELLNEVSNPPESTVVFPEFTIKCPVSSSDVKFVAITINRKDRISQYVPVQPSDLKSDESKFSICLAPLFGESPKLLMLIEFFEYYSIQGADRFIVYVFESTRIVEKLLEFYGKDGKIEIVRIDNSTKCHRRHRCRHEMQLQDCIYRTRGSSKFVATVDLDERIMAIDEKVQLIDVLNSYPMFGELRFRCQWTLRYAENPPDDLINNDSIPPMLKWHNTSHVAPQNHTTKSIVRPEAVESMGVHGVQKFRKNWKSNEMLMLVEPELAVVRHYRLITGWSFFLREAETFGSFSKLYVNRNLTKRIMRRISTKIDGFHQFFKIQ